MASFSTGDASADQKFNMELGIDFEDELEARVAGLPRAPASLTKGALMRMQGAGN